MEQINLPTTFGTIAAHQKVVPDTVPLLLLHGVYYDHQLWRYQIDQITDRTVIALDMPLHGNSRGIVRTDWQLADCAKMLIEVIEALGYDCVYAAGHSWGSMTTLRAAARAPQYFRAVGLCNMPFTAGTLIAKLKFGFQHLLLPFRNFYTDQVAKAMFALASREARPEMVDYLKRSMARLSDRDVRQTDRAVITGADDGRPYLASLTVPALALRGDRDYVGTPPGLDTTVVPGAHTSPLEQPAAVTAFIRRVLAAA